MRILRSAGFFFVIVYFTAVFCSVGKAAEVLIISQTGQLSVTAQNTEKLCQFYGIKYELVDPVYAAPRLKRLLRSLDDYIFAVVIDAQSLETMARRDELYSLRQAVEWTGVHVLVHGCEPNAQVLKGLEGLTGIPEIGFAELNGNVSSFRITRAHPEVTREFTGITKELEIPTTRGPLVIKATGHDEASISLIAANSTDQQAYQPIFAEVRRGRGVIFIAACGPTEKVDGHLINLYNWKYLPALVPTMMFLRYIGGEYCWHRETDYANLTIDDPNLVEPYGSLNYANLLEEMRKYNFHTTIGFIPWNYERTHQSVVDIFLENSQYYSLAIHGNNHDHREFGLYSGRPLDEQREDIAQALIRMERLNQLTSIPYDRVMVFPHAISPEGTLEVLKEYNFLCTVNSGNVPLGSKPMPRFDFNMRPANMDYAAFPSLDRRSTDSDLYVFDLFIDKPALLYGHVYGRKAIFRSGIGGFDPISKKINQIRTRLEWRSLGYIASHLHLEKLNRNGTVSVKMYCNRLHLSNNREVAKTFHILKKETSNVHISQVLVDGKVTEYSIENGYLSLTLKIEPMSTVEIAIIYDGDLPASITPHKADPKVWLLRHSSELRDTVLNTSRLGIPLVLLWEKVGFKIFVFSLLSCLALFLVFMVGLVFFIRKKRITFSLGFLRPRKENVKS